MWLLAARGVRRVPSYNRPKAIADVFIACATIIRRDEYASYDEWLSEVNRRFKAAWSVIEP